MADVVNEAVAGMHATPDSEFNAALSKVQKLAGDDPLLWSVAKEALEEAGYPPKPPWLHVIDMFNARVELTADSFIDITVISHGAKSAGLLDSQLLELTQIQRKVDDMIKAAEKSGKEPNAKELEALSVRAVALSNAKMTSALFGVVREWGGPMFTFRTEQKGDGVTYSAGDAFPQPTSLKLSNPADFALAMAIVAQIPDKVVQMVQSAIAYMNGYGMSGRVKKGN